MINNLLKIILLQLLSLAFVSCVNGSNNRTEGEVTTDVHDILRLKSSEDAGSEATDDVTRETLNEIRFDGWTKKEWADNEYIRAVRKYIDEYNKGEIENPDLDEYKDYMQGKFIIADITPCIVGGAFIYFSFYDYPDKVFAAMVYSDVDEKTKVVSNYECRSLAYEDLDLKITQEEIRQFLKECPEQKMW